MDDILDTGQTMLKTRNEVISAKPASVRLAFSGQTGQEANALKADWVGFTIPDEFVVGYGLDYAKALPPTPPCRHPQTPCLPNNPTSSLQTACEN